MSLVAAVRQKENFNQYQWVKSHILSLNNWKAKVIPCCWIESNDSTWHLLTLLHIVFNRFYRVSSIDCSVSWVKFHSSISTTFSLSLRVDIWRMHERSCAGCVVEVCSIYMETRPSMEVCEVDEILMNEKGSSNVARRVTIVVVAINCCLRFNRISSQSSTSFTSNLVLLKWMSFVAA
jgi:hypothetical protein